MVRLSMNMHHTQICEALPIRLVYGTSGSPWHHALIVDSKKNVKFSYRENEESSELRSGKYKGIDIQWMKYLATSSSYSGWN